MNPHPNIITQPNMEPPSPPPSATPRVLGWFEQHEVGMQYIRRIAAEASPESASSDDEWVSTDDENDDDGEVALLPSPPPEEMHDGRPSRDNDIDQLTERNLAALQAPTSLNGADDDGRQTNTSIREADTPGSTSSDFYMSLDSSSYYFSSDTEANTNADTDTGSGSGSGSGPDSGCAPGRGPFYGYDPIYDSDDDNDHACDLDRDRARDGNDEYDRLSYDYSAEDEMIDFLYSFAWACACIYAYIGACICACVFVLGFLLGCWDCLRG